MDDPNQSQQPSAQGNQGSSNDGGDGNQGASSGQGQPGQNQDAQPQHKKGTITFGSSKPKQNQTDPKLQEALNQIQGFSTRVRSVEERINNIRRSFQLSEKNILDINKKFNQEISNVNTEMTDIKRDLNQLKTQVEMIIKELKLSAKKEEVDVINKYLDMWKPVDFVTQNEVKKIVRQVIYEIGFGQNPYSEDDGGDDEEKADPSEEMGAHMRPHTPHKKNNDEPEEELESDGEDLDENQTGREEVESSSEYEVSKDTSQKKKEPDNTDEKGDKDKNDTSRSKTHIKKDSKKNKKDKKASAENIKKMFS